MRATPNALWLSYVGPAWDGRASWIELAHPDDTSIVEREWRTAVQTGTEMRCQVRLRRHDGEYRWQELRATRMYPHGVSRPEWLIVASDVDDLRLDAERKAEFLAYVSHEVATPLTVIWGNARLLKERFDLLSAEDRRAVLADLEQDADRLRRLMMNLLALARADSQRSTQPQLLHVGTVIERVVKDHQRQYPSRPVTVNVSRDIGGVIAVETYVEEVLVNYVENAEKYTPDRARPIEIAVERKQSEVLVRVMDHGAGIDDAQADRLFRAFVRDRSTSAMAGGSGLGLAVCRWLIQLQGGRVWAHRREGGGSEFGFSLPAARGIRRRRSAD
jgi:signal transduction histidine kinase